MIFDERGQATVLVLGLALVAFAVSGLAVDGTRAFLHRRTLQNSADAAALAGAGEIDRSAYYSGGGKRVTLDPSAARTTALRWVAQRGLDVTASVDTDEVAVHVVLRGEISTSFLSLVGIDRVPVAAEAVAEPIPGSP